MAMTVKEHLQGVKTQEIVVGQISDNPDAITLLSEGIQTETKVVTHNRILGTDGNVVSSVNADGTVTADADFAMLQSRTNVIESWEFPGEHRISISIPHESLYLYGLDTATLNRPVTTTADKNTVNSVINSLESEFARLSRKVRAYRRNQAKYLVATLQAPTLDYQKTMGAKPCVANAADRPTYFNYDNKLELAAMEEAGLDEALNILYGSQKNSNNDDYEVGDFVAALHATKYSIPKRLVSPQDVANVNDRSLADSMTAGSKFIGTFLDTTNTSDWVILGSGHNIRRLNFAGPNVVNGIKFEIHEIGSSGNIEGKNAYGVDLVVFVRSIMVVDSPIGIVKNCTP